MEPLLLPISGYTVTFNSEPTWGELDDIDTFYERSAKGKIDAATGQVQTEFDGTLLKGRRDLVTKTFVTSLKDKDGKELTPVLDAIRKLPYEDGKLVMVKVGELENALKKK